MWAVFTVIAYFLLALLIPLTWALGRVWFKTKVPRRVNCPPTRAPAVIRLDRDFAMRMHVLGEDELRVSDCSRWPERKDCGQECLKKFRTAA